MTNEQRAHDFAITLVNSYMQKLSGTTWTKVFPKVLNGEKIDEEALQSFDMYHVYQIAYNSALTRFKEMFPND